LVSREVLEVAAAMLYRPQPGDELFCRRQKRLNHERVQKVIAVLKENIAGRRPGGTRAQVGVQPVFTSAARSRRKWDADLSIPARFAHGTRRGVAARSRLNVLQVALEVGYSSPSHFSASSRDVRGVVRAFIRGHSFPTGARRVRFATT